MKIRNGFVSNSSSSSFIINKKDITVEQMDKIEDHIKYAKDNFSQLSNADEEWRWKIEDNKDTIILSTWMDNFSMDLFLNLIGIDENKIEIGD